VTQTAAVTRSGSAESRPQTGAGVTDSAAGGASSDSESQAAHGACRGWWQPGWCSVISSVKATVTQTASGSTEGLRADQQCQGGLRVSDLRRNSERGRRAAVNLKCRCAGRWPRPGSPSCVTVTAAELAADSPGRCSSWNSSESGFVQLEVTGSAAPAGGARWWQLRLVLSDQQRQGNGDSDCQWQH
jgi:hypothetical protein